MNGDFLGAQKVAKFLDLWLFLDYIRSHNIFWKIYYNYDTLLLGWWL